MLQIKTKEIALQCYERPFFILKSVRCTYFNVNINQFQTYMLPILYKTPFCPLILVRASLCVFCASQLTKCLCFYADINSHMLVVSTDEAEGKNQWEFNFFGQMWVEILFGCRTLLNPNLLKHPK